MHDLLGSSSGGIDAMGFISLSTAEKSVWALLRFILIISEKYDYLARFSSWLYMYMVCFFAATFSFLCFKCGVSPGWLLGLQAMMLLSLETVVVVGRSQSVPQLPVLHVCSEAVSRAWRMLLPRCLDPMLFGWILSGMKRPFTFQKMWKLSINPICCSWQAEARQVFRPRSLLKDSHPLPSVGMGPEMKDTLKWSFLSASNKNRKSFLRSQTQFSSWGCPMSQRECQFSSYVAVQTGHQAASQLPLWLMCYSQLDFQSWPFPPAPIRIVSILLT